MIHEFTGKGRIFWFPKAWANSVVRWICGVFSPTGTIQVTNNLSPNGEGSLALDVNVNAVLTRIRELRDEREVSQAEVARITYVVRGLLDGSTVVTKGEHVSVDEDWVRRIAEQVLGENEENEEATKTYTTLSGSKGEQVSSPTLNKQTWTRETSDGVKVDVVTRLADDGVGAVVFARTFTFDAQGRLSGVGAEFQEGYVVTGT